MSSLQKCEYFFPRKVYQCACLFQVIKESFHSGDHSLVEILNNIKNFDFFARYYEPLVKVFCVTCGDERKDCIFVWEKHLAIVLLAKRKFVCTEIEHEHTAAVEYDGKKEVYCKGCIKHYLRLMFNYFYFVDFEQTF